MGSGLLYLVSLESAGNWPELARLLLPAYLAVLVGLVPVVIAVKRVFDLLSERDMTLTELSETPPVG